MKEEYLCLCGHSNFEHNKMGPKAWSRFHKQLNVYEDNRDSREKFWKEYMSNGVDNEWACSQCNCISLKMDTLEYLKEIYEGKKK